MAVNYQFATLSLDLSLVLSMGGVILEHVDLSKKWIQIVTINIKKWITLVIIKTTQTNPPCNPDQ